MRDRGRERESADSVLDLRVINSAELDVRMCAGIWSNYAIGKFDTWKKQRPM